MANNSMNFNVTEGKDFRITLNKFHDAKHCLKDEMSDLAKKIRNEEDGLKDDLMDLLKFERKESVIRDKATVLASKVMREKNLVAYKEARKTALAKCKKACEDAVALITDALYDGYLTAFNYDKDNCEEYITALVKFFKDNGFADASASSVLKFYWLGDRASAKNDVTYLKRAVTRDKFADEFLSKIADYLQARNLLTPYKYRYIVVKKEA